MKLVKHQEIDRFKLKELRKGARLTQKELAQGICPVSHISHLETGKQTTSEHLESFARKLGVEVEELLLSTEARDENENALGEQNGTEPEVQACEPSSGADRDTDPRQDGLLEDVKDVELLFQELVEKIGLIETPARRESIGRNERDALLYLNLLLQKAEEIYGDSVRLKRDPVVLESLWYGMRLMARGLGFRLHQCEPSVTRKLDQEARLMVLTLKHRDTYDEHKHFQTLYQEDRALREQAVRELGPDVHADMAEVTLLKICKDCTGTPNCTEPGCPTYRFLQAIDTPPWNENHSTCPYAEAGLVESHEPNSAVSVG